MSLSGRSSNGVVVATGVAVAGLVAGAAWHLEEQTPLTLRPPPAARAAVTLASSARDERQGRAAAEAAPADAHAEAESVPREVVRRMARQMEERRAGVCTVLHVDAQDELFVDGAPVEVPADGTVVLRVPAVERRRAVSVVLRRGSGGEIRRELPCRGSESGSEELEMRWERR